MWWKMIFLGFILLYCIVGMLIGVVTKLLAEKDEVGWIDTLIITALLGIPMLIVVLLDSDNDR